MDTADALAGLEAAFARGGIRDGLAFLNARGGHRYTALYWFDGPTLRNWYFYDRDDPAARDTDDFPVEVTYCVYIRDFRRPFALEDALRDIRVDGHPARHRVRAYCGVPLTEPDGRVFGTLCHFDTVPVPVAEGHVDEMEAMAPLVIRYGDKSHPDGTKKRPAT